MPQPCGCPQERLGPEVLGEGGWARWRWGIGCLLGEAELVTPAWIRGGGGEAKNYGSPLVAMVQDIKPFFILPMCFCSVHTAGACQGRGAGRVGLPRPLGCWGETRGTGK